MPVRKEKFPNVLSFYLKKLQTQEEIKSIVREEIIKIKKWMTKKTTTKETVEKVNVTQL